MDDERLLRYSRQIMLPQIDLEGQERLAASRVLIVGLGGLGSPVALYLGAAGVGHLTLADFDRVEASNLQRQVIHTEARIGRPKAESARTALEALDPALEVGVLEERLDRATLAGVVAGMDLVLDCSDNFETRFAVNAACFAAGVPLVSGAAIRWEGQVASFSGRRPGPCYRCLYPEDGHTDATCAANGIAAPVVGAIGCIQATEALKILVGAGRPLFGRLLLWDALNMDWRSLRLRPDPDCPVCAP